MKSQQQRTAETFDGYKDSYSQAVDRSVAFTGLGTDFFIRVKADYIVDLAVRHLGDPTKAAVLDIGCGVGNYDSVLRPAFGALSGVDVSAECVDTARRRNGDVDYRTYDGAVLPYADVSFDLAFTICVMHHVPPGQWPNFAAEMRRVLKPGGLALVFEHNPRNPLTMRAVNNCQFDEDAVLLRSEETVELLRAAGLKEVRSRYILSVPAAGKVMRRVDTLFSRLPLGAQYYVQATA